MAQFDQVFAELRGKMAAAMAVIAQNPEMAQAVREAIDGAEAAAVEVEAQAQDDARANALSQMIVGVRGVLADAAGVEPVEVVEEPEEPFSEPAPESE